MKHIKQGLCWIYLEEYSAMVKKLMESHAIRGLDRSAIQLSFEEAAKILFK